MKTLERKLAVGFAAVSALLVLLFSTLAWACTASAWVTISRPSGIAGTLVTVTGHEFAPGPVKIFWNSNGKAESGRELASGRTNQRSFSFEVKVPKAAPGVYYITAVVYGEGARTRGGITGKGTEAFQLTAKGSSGGGQAYGGTEIEQAKSLRPGTQNLWEGFESSATGMNSEQPSENQIGRLRADPRLLTGAALLALGLGAIAGSAALAMKVRSRQDTSTAYESDFE